MRRIWLAPVFAFCAGVAFGQNAELSGLIQDPSHAGVSGAEVTIRNEQTGGRRNTSSNASGFYSLPALSPGQYRLSIRAIGFETIVREGIKLEVGENAGIDFSLRLGDFRTEVTVHGDPPLINSENASVGTVIDRDTIDQMPLNGRGIQALIELSPGVVAVPVTVGDRGQFTVNGQRNDANYFTVDGVSANFAVMNPLSPNSGAGAFPLQAGGALIPANNFLGTFSNLVSPDALQEFRIQTSTFAPEFGRSPGAQIGLVTRSGTNRYSGSLFEYFRNDKTDANDWFANQQALPKAPLRFNNFGGTLGGPVRIPHLYDGHDRTFFFLSVEDLATRQPQPPVSFLVPTLEARQNAPPLVAALLNAYPLPNRSSSPIGGDPDVTGYSGYVGSGSLKQDQQTWGLRLDHIFTDKLTSFVRYSRAPSNRLVPPDDPSDIIKYSLGTETLTIGLTQALSPKLVNEIRLNGSRQSATIQSFINSRGGAERPPDSLFFPPGYSSNDSEVSFSAAFLGLSLGFGGGEDSRQLQIVDNLSWSSGAHQFKAGADYRWFSPVTTLPRLDSNVAFPSIYGPSGAYTGTIPTVLVELANIPRTAYVVEAFSAYVQDTWKARRGLTLTYGLRWEVDPAPRVSAGQAAVLNGITNPANLSTGTYMSSGKPFYATSWSNFAPRLGIGWQIHDGAARKTVLRIGAGRFFDLGQGGFETSGDYNAPTFVEYTNQPLGSPTGGSPSFPYGYAPLPLVGGGAVGATHGYNLPYTWQWNATIEQAVGQQTFSAGYVGALGRRLIGWIIAAGPGINFPGLGIIPADDFVMNNDSSSSYNAMQLQFNRRLSSRLHILVSYTWSHSIDDLSQDTPYSAPGSYSLPFDPRAWGASDFDIRHSLNGSIVAALPSPHGGIAGLLCRNWTANSIFFARSALPTDLIIPAGSGYYSGYRPDVVPGQPLYLYGPQFPGGKSFNSAAFSIPPNGLNGDLGRNVLRGMGAWQIDFSLHREFRVSEGLSLQLRAEAFNIFNHPNFANPSDSENSMFTNPGRLTFAPRPGFGSANETLANGLSPSNAVGQLSPLFQIGGPRSMQLALHLRF
jgi:hypothetical protein